MDIVLSRAVGRTGEIRMVKVPYQLYQDFFTLATYHEREYARKEIFARLQQWLKGAYPDYGLINFEDYNRDDAEAVNQRLLQQGKPYRVEWGMYLLIGLGVETDLTRNVTELLTGPENQIENGRQQSHKSLGNGSSKTVEGI